MNRLLPLLLLLGACDRGVDPTDTDQGDTGDVTDTDVVDQPAVCSPHLNLEIVPLDVWGRDLPDATLSFDRTPRLLDDPSAGPGVVLMPLGDEPLELRVILEAPDHVLTSIEVSTTGGTRVDAVSASPPSGGGRTMAFLEDRVLEGTTCPVYTVVLGADHQWFSASGRAPTDNRVDFLMDGQDFYASAYDALILAQRRVTLVTWWWQSDFELVRPDDHPTMSPSQRRPYTAMSVLEGLGGVERRIMVNRLWGENLDWLEYINTDTALRDYASAGGDDFEVVLQANNTDVPVEGQYLEDPPGFSFAERVLANPRYTGRAVAWGDDRAHWRGLGVDAATYHQKAFVVDGEVAFVSGMNVKSTDWDTHDHLVFDPRRMEFDADEDDRLDVVDRESLPDLGPRKDYGVRVEGPAARDVEEVIWERWELALDRDAMYSEHATAFSLDPAAEAPADGIPAQVVATMPGPLAEMSIRETHAKAFANAEQLIFIEDQYFRAPLMDEIIAARMAEEPELLLVVVTKDVSEWDGGKKWTHLADAWYRTHFPDRYLLLRLRSLDLVTEEGWIWDDVDLYVQDVDTHSKLRIVDDRYLSVGSCNYNNRGYLYEGELDVAVLDEGFTRAARDEVFRNLVGPDWWDSLTGEPANDFDVLAMAAESNDSILGWWEDNVDDMDAPEAEGYHFSWWPSGFVYPLEISPDYEFDVGPDLF